MPWSESDVQRVFKASLAPGDDHECPSASEIWDAVHLILPPEERRRIIDQVSRCPACAFSWQAAREMGEETPPVSPPVLPPTESWWQKLLRPATLGPALAGAAAVLVAMVMLDPAADLEPLPAPAPSGVLRGDAPAVRLELSAPATLQPGQRLSWSTVDDAQGYRLTAAGSGDIRWDSVMLEPEWRAEERLWDLFGDGARLELTLEVVGGAADGARARPVTVQLAPR